MNVYSKTETDFYIYRKQTSGYPWRGVAGGRGKTVVNRLRDTNYV